MSVYKHIPTLRQRVLCPFMCILGAYKWALSVSQGLIKHKQHIKAARGCVRQDRSEQRVFTAIKVNSGQPLGIALLLRHVAAALSSQFYGLWPSVSNLQAPPPPLFFKGEKRKHVKANLPAHSLLPPLPHRSSLLLCRCPTLNLWMINLLTEAVRGKTPMLEDPPVSSMTHPVCVVRASTSDLYTHNSHSDNTRALSIFITVHFIIATDCSGQGLDAFSLFKGVKPANPFINLNRFCKK